MAILGNKVLSATAGARAINTANLNLRGMAYPALECPSNGRITRLGIHARKTVGLAGYVWLGLYTLNEQGALSTLLARTDRLSVPDNAAEVSGAITWVNPLLNPTTLASLLMQAGERFAIAVKAEGAGTIYVSLAPSDFNYGEYSRTYTLANTPPPNPYQGVTLEQLTPMAMWAEWTENLAPAAILTTPTAGQMLTTTTPVIAGAFTDPQTGAPFVDRMSAFQLAIINLDSGADVHVGNAALYTPTKQERDAGTFSRTYAGATLTAGPTYGIAVRVADDSGAWSDWTTQRTFTIAARGTVDTATDGAPSGKSDSGIPTAFTGRWSHPNSHAMDQAQVRVYRGGSLFRAGAILAKAAAGTSVAPGTAFSIGNTGVLPESGIGELPPGSYTYTIQGRSATNQLWGPESDPRAFQINYSPVVPTNLQPPSGSTSAAYPLLEWNVTDPDDNYATDDTSDVEITTPTGTVTVYNTSNYDTARGVGFLQLTGVHVPVAGTYKVRIRGKDTSAGVLGEGQWSGYTTFTYVAGGSPVVTITNPTEGETEGTITPNLTWTNTGGTQVRARVILYANDSPVPVKVADISGSSQAMPFPIGWLQKGVQYDVTVTVWVAGEINGTSLRRRFSVTYTDPETPRNVQATPWMERRDYYASPSSIMISFDESIYGPAEFGGYNIYRRLATESPEQATLLRTLTSPGQTRWRDAWPRSRTLYLYGVSQNRWMGGKLIESPITWVEAEIVLAVPILVSTKDPSKRFAMMYMEGNYGGNRERPKSYYTTWGSKKKRTRVSAPKDAAAQTLKLSVTLLRDARGTLEEHTADWVELADSGDTCLFRAENPVESFYCDVDWNWVRGPVGKRILTVTLTEVDYTPGAAGGS